MKTYQPLPYEFHRIFDEITTRCASAPFRHLGRDPSNGLDCLGHVFYVFSSLGLPITMPTEGLYYPRDFWKNGFSQTYLAKLEDQFQAIPEPTAQKGDLLVFLARPQSLAVVHTGILLSFDGRFQHCYRGRGMIESQLRERYWSERLYGVMRYRRMDVLADMSKALPKVVKL